MFLCGYSDIPGVSFDTTKAVKPKDPFCIRDISWMFVIPDKHKKSGDFKKLKIYCVVLNSLDSSQSYTLIKTGGNTCDVRLIGNDWHISYNVNDFYATYSTPDTFTLWNGYGIWPIADRPNNYYPDYHKNNT